MSERETILDVTAGALMRRAFRNELERVKFLGHPIAWHEARGWLGSDFTIRGPKEIIDKISALVTELDAGGNKP